MKMAVFWAVVLYSVVNVHRRFRDASCLHPPHHHRIIKLINNWSGTISFCSSSSQFPQHCSQTKLRTCRDTNCLRGTAFCRKLLPYCNRSFLKMQLPLITLAVVPSPMRLLVSRHWESPPCPPHHTVHGAQAYVPLGRSVLHPLICQGHLAVACP
jgi:hypothetical protein